VDKSVHSLFIFVTINKAKTFLDSRGIFRWSADLTFYVNYRPICIILPAMSFKEMLWFDLYGYFKGDYSKRSEMKIR
jgi:hypothetical protein